MQAETEGERTVAPPAIHEGAGGGGGQGRDVAQRQPERNGTKRVLHGATLRVANPTTLPGRETSPVPLNPA